MFIPRVITALVVVPAFMFLIEAKSGTALIGVTFLLSTLTAGMNAILVKQLTARDDSNKIVFLTHLFLAPMSFIPALFVWSWPPLALVPLLVGMGVFATAGHALLVRGYSMMDASLGLTFEFAKLPFAAVVAYLFFSETIDRWTWLGAFIIIGSASYIAHREAKVRAETRAQAMAGSAADTNSEPVATSSNVVRLADARARTVAAATVTMRTLRRRLRRG